MQRVIPRLVKFYEGGVQYEYLISAPITEVLLLTEEAGKIAEEIRKASK